MSETRILFIQNNLISNKATEDVLSKYGLFVQESVSGLEELTNKIAIYQANLLIISYEFLLEIDSKQTILELLDIHKLIICTSMEHINLQPINKLESYILFMDGDSTQRLNLSIERILIQILSEAKYQKQFLEKNQYVDELTLPIITLNIAKLREYFERTSIRPPASMEYLTSQILDGYLQFSYANWEMINLFGDNCFEDFVSKGKYHFFKKNTTKIRELIFEILNGSRAGHIIFEFAQSGGECLYYQFSYKFRNSIENDLIVLTGSDISKYIKDQIVLNRKISENSFRISDLNAINEDIRDTLNKEIRKREYIDSELQQLRISLNDYISGVFTIDEKGIVKYSNQTTLDILELTNEKDFVGKSIYKFIQKSYIVEIKDFLKKDKAWRGEIRIEDFNKLYKIVYAAIYRHIDPNNGSFSYNCTCIDISKLKELEIELNQSERKFRFIVDNIGDGIYTIENGNISYANIALLDMMGYKAEQVLNKEFIQFVAPEDRNYVIENYYKMLDGTASNVEYSFNLLKSDNTTRVLVSRKGTTLKYKDGFILLGRLTKTIDSSNRNMELQEINRKLDEQVKSRTQGFLNANKMLMQEINQRKKAEDTLREQEQRIRIISEYISDFVYVCEISKSNLFYFTWIKGAFRNITGYEYEEINSLPLGHLSVILEEDRNKYLTDIEEVKQNNSKIMEYRIKRKKDEIIWIKDYVKLIDSNPEKGTYTVIGAVQNIDQAIKKENEVRAYQNQLEHLMIYVEESRDYEKKKISANLQNVAMNLLTALKMEIILMKKQIASEELNNKTEDAEQLVENLIQYIRSLSLQLRPVMLEHFGIIPALDWYAEQLKISNSNINFETNLEIDEIELSEKNASLIFRIIQELVNNSIAHSQATMIRIEAKQSNEASIFEVIDNGIGFDVEEYTQTKFGLMLLIKKAKFIDASLSFEIKENFTIARLSIGEYGKE